MRIRHLLARRGRHRRRSPFPASTGSTLASARHGRRQHARRPRRPPCRCPSRQWSRPRFRSTLDYAARTESIRAITLQAKVSAYIKEQPAADGADVKAGDLLYRLDPRDFQVALDQAKAQIERDAASLDYQKSQLPARRRAVERAAGSPRTPSTSERAACTRPKRRLRLHRAASARRAAQPRSTPRSARRSPGRLGRNQAPVGTLVGAGTTVLNTLVQLDPIYVTFNPSETDLAAIAAARRGRHGRGRPSACPARRDDSVHKGELTFIDNAVDRATGTVTARATIANADFGLLPGQYVRVSLHVKRPARRAARAAGRDRLEPARQIRLCRRRQQQGRAEARVAWHRCRATAWRS